MSSRYFSTGRTACFGAFVWIFLIPPLPLPLAVFQSPPHSGGGVQILPSPPAMGKADPELPPELSDLQREPKPGLYTSAPWTMIIRVPGPITAPMPTTVPPKGRFHDRSIEPEILLVPKEEPRFQ